MAKVRILSGSEPATLIEKNITANGTYNASADDADGYSSVNVNVSPILISKTITENGTYTASSEPGTPDGYSQVVVNVPTGAEGVLVGSGEPLPTQGVNGDYYYQRSNVSSLALNGWRVDTGTSQSIGGFRFIPTSNIKVCGVQSYNQNSTPITGKVGIYDANGNALSESIGLTFNYGWNTNYIPEVELTAGQLYYVITSFNSSGYMCFTNMSYTTIDSRLSSVQGVYGSIIGNIDNSNIYDTNMLICDDTEPLYVNTQYIKQNGTWVKIPSGII